MPLQTVQLCYALNAFGMPDSCSWFTPVSTCTRTKCRRTRNCRPTFPPKCSQSHKKNRPPLHSPRSKRICSKLCPPQLQPMQLRWLPLNLQPHKRITFIRHGAQSAPTARRRPSNSSPSPSWVPVSESTEVIYSLVILLINLPFIFYPSISPSPSRTHNPRVGRRVHLPRPGHCL